MSYLVIQDFKIGMDRRKSRVTGQPGALWTGVNGHITRGGDFEGRKKFVAKYTLPTGATKGCGAVGGQLYTWGAGPTPGGFPAGMSYQQLAHPTNPVATITEILYVTTFSGKLYVVARFSDGNIYHYYDGSRVLSWDSIASSVASNNAVASSLASRIDAVTSYTASAVGSVVTITAAFAGTPFSIAGSTSNGGAVNDQTVTIVEVQPNVTAVVEIRATATLTITGGTANPGVNRMTNLAVNGVNILGANVDWVTSNSATAAAIAAQINTFTSAPDYTAAAVGATITITAAAGTGAAPNGFVVTPTNGGNLTTSNTNMGGGVTAVTAVAQIATATIGGTFEAADTYIVTLDGTDYIVSGSAAGTGTTALTYKQKVYSVTNSLLYFSALNAPTQFGSGIGSGYINMANQNEGDETLTTAQEYQGDLAVFSRNNIRVWSIDVDPLNNLAKQTVSNTGTLAPRSVIPYGNIDVFYLHDSGVRSLRARDASNSPAVNDVGVAIDSFIQEYMSEIGETRSQKAVSAIEPIDGRYWVALGNRIFVFSYFPGSKINAWTYYDLTTDIGASDITDIVKINNRVYIRAGDFVYLYGGDGNNIYPNTGECVTEMILPFLAAGTPATFKGLTAFDAVMDGTWRCWLLPDPSDETVELEIGTFYKPTFAQGTVAIKTPTNMFGLRMRCDSSGYRRMSMAAVHYRGLPS